MKRVVFFFLLLVSFIFSFDYSAKAKINDEFYSIGLGNVGYITEKDTFLFDLSFGKSTLSSLGVGAAYRRDASGFSWIVGVEDSFAKYTDTSYYFGALFPYDWSDLEVGGSLKNSKVIPYLTYSYNFGAMVPYVKISDRIMLGINYGFDLDQLSGGAEYFKMVYPISDLETTKKTIVVKGYFLDTGKIYLNGEEMPIRSDGMFIKTVDNNYGINDFSIVMDGKHLKKQYDFKIIRKYPFYDLDVELQKKWGKLFDLTAYPKGDEFLPNQVVTRGDFYLIFGRVMGLGKKGYEFKEFFTDVFDAELKKYLNAFYGNGYLRTPQAQFVPEKPILRQEALTIISRLLPEITANVRFNFTDVPTKDWFYGPANKLANYGVLDNPTVEPRVVLKRGDFFKYLYLIKDNFELLKEPLLENRQEVIVPVVINVVATADLSKYTLKDINLISPYEGERVASSSFYVKGFTTPGLKVRINNSLVETNRLGRFADEVKITPGLNKLTIGVNKDVKEFKILYLKKFNDLVTSDINVVLIERVSTLTGYKVDQDNFSPEEFVTKDEIINLLFNMGYLSDERKNQLLQNTKQQFGPQGNTGDYVKAEDAVSFFIMLAGSSFEPSWGQEILSRRKLIILLSEIPKVKKQINDFYEVKKIL